MPSTSRSSSSAAAQPPSPGRAAAAAAAPAPACAAAAAWPDAPVTPTAAALAAARRAVFSAESRLDALHASAVERYASAAEAMGASLLPPRGAAEVLALLSPLTAAIEAGGAPPADTPRVLCELAAGAAAARAELARARAAEAAARVADEAATRERAAAALPG